MMRKFRQFVFLSQLFVLLFGIAQPLYAIDVDNDKLRGVLFPLYSTTSGDSPCRDNLSGSNNQQIVFNFLVSKGLSFEQSAGFVGNFMLESGQSIDPRAVNPKSGATGIAQWLGGRKSRLLEFAEASGSDPFTLEVQLEYVWFELTNEPITTGIPGGTERAAYEAVLGATTVAQATEIVTLKYERPGEKERLIDTRTQYAEFAFKSYSGQTTTNGVCSGVGGVDTFPLITTKTAIKAGVAGAKWCYSSTTNCHHDYNAADIHALPGTEVVASKGGKVVRARERVGSVGSSVTILGNDGQYTYYYTHMEYGSLQVNEQDEVTTGQALGRVGESEQAVGTAPHVHYDMLPQDEYRFRPNCAGADCRGYPFINVQPLLKQVYDLQIPD